MVITALFLVLLINRYNNHTTLSTRKGTDNSHSSANKLKCCTCLTTSYLILFFTLVYAFLAAFIYCFSEFISFSNSGGGGGSYIATLTPSLLLTGLGIFLTFILKKQISLHNFKSISKSDDQDESNKSEKSEDSRSSSEMP